LVYEDEPENENSFGGFAGVEIYLTPSALIKVEGQVISKESIFIALEYHFNFFRLLPVSFPVWLNQLFKFQRLSVKLFIIHILFDKFIKLFGSLNLRFNQIIPDPSPG